jgi:hypothetical protein
MRTVFEPSIRTCVMKIVASFGAILLSAGGVAAGPAKIIRARASGQVVSRTVCSTLLCQETHVTGIASVLGTFEGVLSDRINLADGTYTGTGVFTMADGSTITTEYTGQVGPPDANGVSSFFESQHMVDGTGKYEGSSGDLEVTGTVDAALRVEIVAFGTLSK